MASRRLERELAVQLAYALDITGDAFEDARYRFTQVEPRRRQGWGEYAERLSEQSILRREEIDGRLREALEHWRLERLGFIDRSILRLAACEIMFLDDVPLRVTIDEFISIARRYGNDESPAFVNGVLDRIAQDFPEKDFGAAKAKKERPAQ
jgi:N utilization substance protein B